MLSREGCGFRGGRGARVGGGLGCEGAKAHRGGSRGSAAAAGFAFTNARKKAGAELDSTILFFFGVQTFSAPGGGLRGVPKPELRFSIAAGRIEANLIYPCERSSVHVLEERERTLQIDEAIPGLGHECLWVAIGRRNLCWRAAATHLSGAQRI